MMSLSETLDDSAVANGDSVAPSRIDDPEHRARHALRRADTEGALEVLMEAYGTAVYRYCLHLLGDSELAEEVHQTTFIQAFDGLRGFLGKSTLQTWLFGIARHRCLDAAKVRRRRESRFELADTVPERPAPSPGPDEELSARRHLDALTECLANLGPQVRDSILLRFQQGLSYVEMSRLSGEQAPTLRARVVRALPALKQCLEQKGATP